MPISYTNHLFDMAFAWDWTKETIHNDPETSE